MPRKPLPRIPANRDRVLVGRSEGTPVFRRPDKTGPDGKGAHLDDPAEVRWSKFWTDRLLAGEIEIVTED